MEQHSHLRLFLVFLRVSLLFVSGAVFAPLALSETTPNTIPWSIAPTIETLQKWSHNSTNDYWLTQGEVMTDFCSSQEVPSIGKSVLNCPDGAINPPYNTPNIDGNYTFLFTYEICDPNCSPFNGSGQITRTTTTEPSCIDSNYVYSEDLDTDGVIDECNRGSCSVPQGETLTIAISKGEEPSNPVVGDTYCSKSSVSSAYCEKTYKEYSYEGQQYNVWSGGSSSGNICGPLEDAVNTPPAINESTEEVCTESNGQWICEYQPEDVCPGGVCENGCGTLNDEAFCLEEDANSDGSPELTHGAEGSGQEAGAGTGTGDSGTGDTGGGTGTGDTGGTTGDGTETTPWTHGAASGTVFDDQKPLDAAVQAKLEFDEKLGIIKSEMRISFGEFVEPVGGSLPCIPMSFDAHFFSVNQSLCLDAFHIYFDILKQVLLWMFLLLAAFIILRGSKD